MENSEQPVAPANRGAARVDAVLPIVVYVAIALAATLLLWPALWNGYPLVFSDTGTYLAQAIEHYAGWDRPIFYSLFLLPLHMTLTTWPAIAVQAPVGRERARSSTPARPASPRQAVKRKS